MGRFRFTPGMAIAVALLALSSLSTPGSSQLALTAGVGRTLPLGPLEDLATLGMTLRAQTAIGRLGQIEPHLQVGWSRFPSRELTDGDQTVVYDDLQLYHLGLGGRVSSGRAWVGGTVVVSLGDSLDERDFSATGIGLLPETGFRLGRLEIVSDALVHRDARWMSLRVAVAL